VTVDLADEWSTTGNSEPVGGSIENDDDTRTAVGDWIEVECAEITEVPKGARRLKDGG